MMRGGSERRTVVRLDEEAARSREVAGRKAATLAELRDEGHTVPDGFVVTAGACGRLDEADVRAEIAAALEELCGRDGAEVAVRSSAVAEDLAEASYAGLYETVLGVRGAEAVVEAVRRCVASSRSARVAAYGGAAGSAAGMAVLVQRMVDAKAAGVAFSADPVSGDRDVTVVSAVRGLGDRLVDGTATPDEWEVRGDTVEARSVADGVLDEEAVLEVAALARRLEERAGTPQDVEWAHDGEQVRLLQARPITVLPTRPELEPPESGSWMKDRAHYPEPLTPFGASTFLPALGHGIETMCSEFGLLIERVEQRSLGGEVYGRPVPVGGKEGPPPPWWLMGVLARVVPPLRRRCAAARSAVRGGLLDELPARWEREWRDEFVGAAERMASVELSALDDGALLAHLDEAVDLLWRGQEVHFRLFIPYVVRVHRFASVCEELLGWSAVEALDLLTGRSETSAAPTRALEELARQVAEVPDARAAVEAGDLGALRATGAPGEAFEEYRRRWGVRTSGYDPGSRTLAEQPGLLLGWLRDALDSVAAEADGTGAAGDDGNSGLERARELLAGRPEGERARFEEALDEAASVYGLREDNVLWTDNVPCGLIRLAAVEAGRRLHERRLLDRADDVAHLELDELRRALREGVDHSELARRRRAERAWVLAHPGPPFLGEEGAPPPDVRALPAEARMVNGALMWAMSHEYPPPGADPAADATDALVDGVAGSPGRYTGPVRVVRDETQFGRLRPGDVLVCTVTTPAWSVLFGRAGAVVTDGGSALSHAAIVAREHRIPAVLGTGRATAELRDGDLVTVDGSTGRVLPA